MASQLSSHDDLIHNDLSEESGQSSFACTNCRRSKIKCDRALAVCGNCAKASKLCTYPLTVQKPGPKAGTHRRPRAPPPQSDNSEDVTHLAKKMKIDHDDPHSPNSPSRCMSQPSSNGNYSKDTAIRRGSTTVSSNSQSQKATSKPHNPFLRLVHPDHEPPDTETMSETSPCAHEKEFKTRFNEACAALGCSGEQGWELIKVYFSSMTSYSLFHRPTFEDKLKNICSAQQLQAFLSALFSYALRFRESNQLLKHMKVSALDMLETACQLQNQCVEDCLDENPPLHLLQSFFLVTFQKLIHGVRGKTWRMLGDCIRLGYELRLHLVDADSIRSQSDVEHESDSESWVLAEEKRRLWWSLWEMDVFTCTIRKLPTAIDERLNFTFLPSSDENWFSGTEVRSCFFSADATQRWRDVAECGNQSPQTWFILINSYMFDAFQMGAFPEVWRRRIGFDNKEASDGDITRLVPRMRDFLENNVRCAHMSLPRELNWEDRFLAFKPSTTTGKTSLRSLDCARYGIHIMCQLCRLMLCIWEVNNAPINGSNLQSNPVNMVSSSFGAGIDAKADRQTWDRYIDAANLTAQVIRNSSPQHYQYVNPLIANAVWFAAASLVVAKLFGPPGFDSRLAQSNFDLLVATLNKFESFWQIPSVLKYKLRNLEETLKHLQRKPAVSPRPQNDISTEGNTPLAEAVQMQESIMQSPYAPNAFQQSVPALNTSSDIYAALDGQDWTSSGIFDFNAIPSFGFGQSEFFQSMPFDNSFDGNVLMQNDSLNFNDLFAYPYQ